MPVSRAIRGVGQSVSAILRDVASSRRERASERLDIANLGFRERKEESESSLRRVSAERESYLDTPSTLGEILGRSDLEKRSPETFKMFSGLLDRKNPVTGNFFKDEITTPRQAVAMVQQFQLENSKQRGRVEIAEIQAGGRAAGALGRKQESNRKEISRIKAKVFERRQDLQKAESQDDENRILKEIIRLNNEIKGLEGTQPAAQPTRPAAPTTAEEALVRPTTPGAVEDPSAPITGPSGEILFFTPDPNGPAVRNGVRGFYDVEAGEVTETTPPPNTVKAPRTGIDPFTALEGVQVGRAFRAFKRFNKTIADRDKERQSKIRPEERGTSPFVRKLGSFF